MIIRTTFFLQSNLQVMGSKLKLLFVLVCLVVAVRAVDDEAKGNETEIDLEKSKGKCKWNSLVIV